MTLIKDVLARDITDWEIPNLGVAKVGMPNTDQAWQVLRHELQTFVADGEYGIGLDRILTSYLTHLEHPSQPAAWVSGFFGSGKSHLVRVLDALWIDREFPDGARASGLTSLPPELAAHFRELETRSRSYGGRFSAAGMLSAGGSSVALAILSIVFASAGLPENAAQAELVLWMRREGFEDAVRTHLKTRGTTLEDELPDLYVSDVLAEAILAARPTLANSVAEMLQLLRVQYPSVANLDETSFLEVLQRTLRSTTQDGQLPLTLIVLDELQQFIANNEQRALEVQHLVEKICSELGSRVLVVATGQMALGSTPILQKLVDRFRVTVSLQDKDVDQVVRSVVLRKKPERQQELSAVLDQVSGEIDRQMAGSAIGPRAADKVDLVADYPLLPARRRLWEHMLRSLDLTGRSGQLRTQLRVVLDATKSVAGRDVGVAVAADRIYEDMESTLQQSGALPAATAQLIADLDDGTPDGKLQCRVARVVYLLSQLPSTGPQATGLKATPDYVADMLVEDLRSDGARIRQAVPAALAKLVKRSVVLEVDGAYLLQTPAAAEWDSEFQAHQRSLASDSRWLAEQRDRLVREAFADIERQVRPQQGSETRKAKAYFGPDEPAAAGGEVPIWVRDEWSVTERQAQDDARRVGTDSPLVTVWIPRAQSEALQAAMAEAEAAQRTVDRRAVPTTDDGNNARQALITRREAARSREKEIAKRIVGQGRVYQGGGNLVETGQGTETLLPSLRKAVDSAVLRLFPEFGVADHAGWGTAIKRAREGSADPFAPVGHRGDVEQHPVAKQVLAYVGVAGKRGQDVRAHFRDSPYGWPQDAVDASLLALVAAGRVQGRYNGMPLDLSLAQNSLGSADFRAESVVVPVSARMKVKGLATTLGLSTDRSDVEMAKSILERVRDLAIAAGGEAPLPATPSVEHIRDLEGETGNAMVMAVADAKDGLEADAKAWQQRASLIPARRTEWEQARSLLRHVDGLGEHASAAATLQAIESGRSLLDEPDPVAPVVTALTDELRGVIKERTAAYETARSAALADLAVNPSWATLSQHEQDEILHGCGLGARDGLAVGTTDQLIRALDAQPISGWQDRIDAIPTQVVRAQTELLRRSAKAPVPVVVPSTVIETTAHLDRYLEDVRSRVQPHLDNNESVVI